MGSKSIYSSGAAFNGNKLMGTRPLSSIPNKTRTNFVSFTEWCQKNYISKDQGRYLIKKKMLIAQRLWGQWWVCANPYCLDELLKYLNVEELTFDADNSES